MTKHLFLLVSQSCVKARFEHIINYSSGVNFTAGTVRFHHRHYKKQRKLPLRFLSMQQSISLPRMVRKVPLTAFRNAAATTLAGFFTSPFLCAELKAREL